MVNNMSLRDGFQYHKEYTRDEFLRAFFENPEAFMTMSEIMAAQLNAINYKEGKCQEVINNPWWGITTMTKSGIARWHDRSEGYMMKVIPDLGTIAEKLFKCFKKFNNQGSWEQGIEVTERLINSVDGFTFKREDFNYHKKTHLTGVEDVLEDLILGGICQDNPKVLVQYITTLFEIGGVPKKQKDGVLEAHLNVIPSCGADTPIIDFYMLAFRSWSDSSIGREIRTPFESDEYATVRRI